MIIYLDASALVKKYVAEPHSAEVIDLIVQAKVAGTSLLSRAEVVATLAKLVRMNALHKDEAVSALQIFRQHWRDYERLQVTEALITRADALAWEYGLRGYDAVHLASALRWQEALAEPITLATFDRQLWYSGQAAGLNVWPPALPHT